MALIVGAISRDLRNTTGLFFLGLNIRGANMGIVVDLPNTTINFHDPKKTVPMMAISNFFLCVQHAFDFNFAVTFDPNPRNGVGGSPAAREPWQIGVVQNVVFEMYNFEYDDGSKFKVTFDHPVVDSSSTGYFPFYGDPVIVQACKIDPILKCDKYIPMMIPVAEIWYTGQGYGELLDPYTPPYVAIDNNPSSFNISDEPYFGARLRLKNGALIKRAESISAFQTWLVAITPKQPLVLATIPAFSLVFWMTTKDTTGLLSIGTPGYDFAYYGEKGISRAVKTNGEAPTLAPILGSGGRSPILSGQTANDRANKWLQDQGLVPDPISLSTP